MVIKCEGKFSSTMFKASTLTSLYDLMVHHGEIRCTIFIFTFLLLNNERDLAAETPHNCSSKMIRLFVRICGEELARQIDVFLEVSWEVCR
jgi:hypothetical protein